MTCRASGSHQAGEGMSSGASEGAAKGPAKGTAVKKRVMVRRSPREPSMFQIGFKRLPREVGADMLNLEDDPTEMARELGVTDWGNR